MGSHFFFIAKETKTYTPGNTLLRLLGLGNNIFFFSYSSKRWVILNRLCIHASAGIYLTRSSGLLQLDP